MDIISYILSRKYTDMSIVGLGALKGANCTVKDIVHQDGINTVTFEWEGTDGTKKTRDMVVYDGTPIYVWESGNTYHYGDLAIYESQFYRCIVENHDTDFDNTKWNEIGSPDGNYDLVQSKSLLPPRFTSADRKLYFVIDESVFYLWDGVEWVAQNNLVQVNTFPTADVKYIGKMYQYVGATNATYTHGFIYECVEDGGAYLWRVYSAPIIRGAGNNSVIEGDIEHNIANAEYSHAEGSYSQITSTINGKYGHAEGYHSSVNANYGHAEGNYSVVNGTGGHAEGCSNANGQYSHSQNEHTIANGAYQTAIGKYNVAQGSALSAQLTDHAFIIGNGTDNTHRSNALAVQWDGTVVMQDGSTIKSAKTVYEVMGEMGAKNILAYPYTYTAMNPYIMNGITYTFYDDGSINVDGSTTSYSTCHLHRAFQLYPHGDYIISCDGLIQGVSFEFGYVDNGTFHSISSVKYDTPSKQFSITDEFDSYQLGVRVVVNPNITVDNITIYPMIRLANYQDPTWQPYAMTNKELTDKTNSLQSQVNVRLEEISVLPTASATYLNKRYLYVGATDANYTKGGIYECQEVIPSTSPKTYHWVRISAERQIQADWTQTDSNEVDYIKNKPTLGTASAKNYTSNVRPNNTDLVESHAVYSAINSALSSIYVPRGELSCAELTTDLLIPANVGNVYTMSDSGTTSALFINGAGHPIAVNDNVGIIRAGADSIMFNLMGNAFDLHDYQTKELETPITIDGSNETTVEGAIETLNDKKMSYEVNGILGAKNLIPYPYKSFGGGTQSGVTFTVNNDGSVTLNGTATTSIYKLFVEYDFGEFPFSSKYDNPRSQYRATLLNGTSHVYLNYNIQDHYTTLVIDNGTTIDNLTVYPMIRYASDTDSTWRPYAMTNKELTDRANETHENTPYVTLEQYGAVGDGITDDTSAFISAMNSGKEIHLLDKTYAVSASITKNYTTIKGKGKIEGTLTINANFVNISDIEINCNNGTCIVLKSGQYITFDRIKTTNCENSFYIPKPSQHQPIARVLISNSILRGKYGFNCDDDEYEYYSIGDIQIENTQFFSKIYGIYGKTFDGLVVTGCTFFMDTHQAVNVNKKGNIYVKGSNYVNITGNNLFEAGIESIYLSDVRGVTINGNNIVWCGQIIPSSGIVIDGNKKNANLTSIEIINNNIQYPTDDAIVVKNISDINDANEKYVINIANNVALNVLDNTFYHGTDSLKDMAYIVNSSTIDINKVLIDNNIGTGKVYPNSGSTSNIYKLMGEVGAKNLITYPYTHTSSSQYGVTLTVNTDGSISANGISNGYCSLSLNRDDNETVVNKIFSKAGQYRISIAVDDANKIDTTTGIGLLVRFIDLSDSSYLMDEMVNISHYKNYNESTITVPQNWIDGINNGTISLEVRVYVGRDSTIDNAILYPMIRYADDKDTTYQPFAFTNKELTDKVHEIESETPYVTPEQFGAVGDGVTDDTQAFQKALAQDLPIHLNSKLYLINSDLSIAHNNTVIIGTTARYNAPSSRIKFANNHGFVIEGSIWNVTLKDFYISSTNVGITMQGNSRMGDFKFEGLYFYCRRSILVDTETGYMYFNNCHFSFNTNTTYDGDLVKIAYSSSGLNRANYITFNQCEFEGSDIPNNITDNTSYLIHLENCSNITFTLCDMCNCYNAFKFGGNIANTYYITVEGNSFWNIKTIAELQKCYYFLMVGNRHYLPPENTDIIEPLIFPTVDNRKDVITSNIFNKWSTVTNENLYSVFNNNIFRNTPTSNVLIQLHVDESQYRQYLDEITVLPTASVDYLNHIYLLTDAQTSYQKGGIYQCVSDGEPTPTYSWQLISSVDMVEFTAQELQAMW